MIKEQIKAIIKQYADKGKTQYRECCDDNESASLINYWDGYRDCAYNLLRELEDVQEEPKVKESAKTQHANETCKENGDSLTQEPVNKDFEMALAEMIDKAQKCVVEPWVVAAQWKDELIKLAKSEEPVSGDDENALNSVAITFLQEQQIVPNFYADIIMKAVKRGANWQKEQMMAKAIRGHVGQTINGMLRALSDETFGDMGFTAGDEVKLIILKEG